MAGPSLMDSFFQRSLDDLIKGIRLCLPGGEAAFIAKSVDEIRREIKSTDSQTKATALQKLTYLHSLHWVDMSWAAFPAVELSSSSVHSHKRLALLSASLSFNPTTDVILLLTHQLRKDFSSSNPHDVSLALSTLSSISTLDLSRDLTPELFILLNSSKNFVKKKAIAAILRVFEQYPEAVRVCFKRIVENLESSDMGVLSAAVGLFCELTVREPRSYLPLAPEFYKILLDSRNNWVLIKVLKIFAKLAPLEPRLAKRIVEPICEHLRRTGSKSLAFECVNTIVTSLSEHEPAVKLAIMKIQEFLLENDPNLKYLGLQALAVVAAKHSWAVLENKEVVIKSLDDVDVNIKLESLQLVMAMVSEDNLAEICKVLISYALKSEPEFCNEILGSILSTCSRNFYEVIVDFDWYVSLLGEMSRIPHCQKGDDIETQLIDIGMRVKDVRLELVHVARGLLIDPALLGNPFIHNVLSAAAWLSGEYVEFSRNLLELMESLLQPRTCLLPSPIRAVYIQSAFKVLTFGVYSFLSTGDDASYPSELTDFVLKEDFQESSETVTSAPISGADLSNGLNPRSSHPSAGNGEDPVIAHEQTSSASSKKQQLTQKSVMDLVNLVEVNLGPLAGSHEVEIQERASNILGMIGMIKPRIHSSMDESEGDRIKRELRASGMMKLMFDAFSEELGPVSVSAQERVPIPEGLVLKESLSDIEAICDHIKLPISSSFSLVRSHSLNNATTIHEHPSKEEYEPSSESTSLLAEHRKRHGIYYLSSENKVMISDDYPPALELKDQAIDEAEDLVKLTKQSLDLRKKRNQAKPRPVVVKLDDGEGAHIVVKKPQLKDDLISGAVREVLLGNEAASSSSNKAIKKREKNELNIDRPESNITMTSTVASEPGNASSRHKLRISGKEKKRSSSGKEKKEHDHKHNQKSDRIHAKHKSRQRADGTLNVAAQSPVIPDFLL
ncbi:AP-3 complex subunit delta [Olea europaea subsp. europaea]|uniref:AP-3 complex subunit delta n=1 Tax=Olea europaea subsp. europaea TaxID=158383 RepID=A0A8S0V0P4_OLEEU|nr:AP-3 complex subunit delta [Olea europaea subsp. europaea]